MSDDVLSQTSIKINGSASTRDDAISEANELLLAAGAVTNDYLTSMLAREESESSYVGNFFAAPRGGAESAAAVLTPGISMVRYSKPVDWGGNEVRFVVAIASDEEGTAQILARLTDIFSDAELVEKVRHAPSDEAVFALLSVVNER
ncbi:PTS sugar transporter subunit IIA [Subtercola lobariae]|nr:PTS sugar transporter subunit IIA [Subtercola lobariae]